MSQDFSFSIKNEKAFIDAISRLQARSTDLRIPFRLIASDFYRSQKAIFQLQSAGKYEDLSTKPFIAWWQNIHGKGSFYAGGYKEYKKENLGFDYPILKGEHRNIELSTTTRNHKYSLFNLSKDVMIIGTTVPYGKFHQSDRSRKKIPQRKFIFIDGYDPGTSAGSKYSIAGRRQRWISIVDTHLQQLITGKI